MKEKVLLAILTAVLLTLASCSGEARAVDGPAAGDPGKADCPAPGPETRRLTIADPGYCLLYPTPYKIEKPSPGQTDLVIGSLLNVSDPRVSIAVEAAEGRTAADVAEEVIRDLNVEGNRSTVAIGGVEAVVLDKLPGQEMNRQVLFEHDGWLYRLTFTPADKSVEAYGGMEELYSIVIDSFSFTLAGEMAESECLEPKAGEEMLTESELGFCVLVPEDYDAEKTSERHVVINVGSLLDVDHARVYVEMSEAGGQDAQALAEAAASELEAVMPGLSVERSFGLTMGYEPAFVLDNVPGQDISRQVYAVHGDQLYKLTFVPASEDAGEVFGQMEALYDLVTKSFRFLD
jgi:hypothetical protein